MLFLHSIVPHLHVKEVAGTHHHTTSNKEHNQDDDNFLKNVFANLQHQSSGQQLTDAPLLCCAFFKYSVSKDFHAAARYVMQQYIKPPLLFYSSPPSSFTLPGYLSSCSFRGPPAV